MVDSDAEEMDHLLGIVRAFGEYEARSTAIVHQMQANYQASPQKFQQAVPDFIGKCQALENCIWVNQEFLYRVSEVAFLLFPELRVKTDNTSAQQMDEHAAKVAVTVSQMTRDWSQEGAAEREMCFGPLLRAVEAHFPDKSKRSKLRVLVPGCGLARLPWEFAMRGFETHGNEFTYFMLLASNFILHKPAEDQYKIYPFATNWRSSQSLEDQTRPILVPDVDTSQTHIMMQAGDFLVEYSHPHSRGAWNAIATCFFLDTAMNVMDYVRQIARLLAEGGIWVNIGPLLYHYSELNTYQRKRFPSLELTYEELKGTFPGFGLKLVEEKFHTRSTYNDDKQCMAHTVYECVFFACVKVGVPVDEALTEPPSNPNDSLEIPTVVHFSSDTLSSSTATSSAASSSPSSASSSLPIAATSIFQDLTFSSKAVAKRTKK